MDAVKFGKTFSELESERSELFEQRAEVEANLIEIKKKIEHLDAILEHLAPLAGVTTERSFSGLGITDAIRSTLKGASSLMSAQDVQESLINKGLDLAGLSAPMASIYKVLSRLVDSDEIERVPGDGKRVFYRWAYPDTGITDDDIPF